MGASSLSEKSSRVASPTAEKAEPRATTLGSSAIAANPKPKSVKLGALTSHRGLRWRAEGRGTDEVSTVLSRTLSLQRSSRWLSKGPYMTPEPERFVRTSETGIWRQCLLKWYFAQYLGYLSDRINPAFWLGTLVHFALSEYHLGRVENPAHFFWWLGNESIKHERSQRIVIEGMDIDVEDLGELEKALDLGTEMLTGYVEWANDHHSDFDTLDSELSLFLPLATLDGYDFTYVAKFDLLTEDSEGIRVRDFKTAKDFRATSTVDQDQQFRRYPWLVREAFPDWADDVLGSTWVGLRKIIPSNRSKPPYFDTRNVDLAPGEYDGIKREVLAEVTDMLATERALDSGEDPRDLIYPSPTMDCTWRCDFFVNGMCRSWRSGLPHEQIIELAELHGSVGNDHYAEYKDEFADSVSTIGRREGGD